MIALAHGRDGRANGVFAMDGETMPAEPKLSPNLSRAAVAEADSLADLDVTVRVELGRAILPPDELSKVQDGHVIPLDAQPDDPVQVFINDRFVARGRLVIVDDRFCVEVSEVVANISFDGDEETP